MATIDAGRLIAGRYQLDARLDSGGRAQVWSATDKELDRPVAVKILLTPEEGASAFLEAFREEAQVEARLQHPGIAAVLDWGHDNIANYEVMELLEGQTVRRWLESGPLAPDRVIAIGRQAAAALAYAHAEGVAHGSINPERVIVGADSHTTLIDFGMHCRGQCEFSSMPDADTFALGALLYEMLTGVSPLEPRPENAGAHEPWPRHAHKLNPNVPPALDAVVMKAIASDPADRYQTAAEFQAALDALVRPKPRVWPWLLLLAVAIAIAAAGTWYFASQMKVVVPDVTGMTSAQAQTTLASVGLRMVATGQSASPGIPAGSVVSESPPAGSKLRRNAQVSVVLSTGKPSAQVPAVTGLSLQDASSAIMSAGFVVGSVSKRSSTTFPDNTVISQNPAAGTVLTAGSGVDMVVSGGQATVTVPDVRGDSQATATRQIRALGLALQVGQVFSSQRSGTVVSQGPAGGTTVPSGSTVSISVSRGRTPVVVPDVKAALEADAKTSLQALGLVPVSFTQDGTASQVGRVISQSPAAGTRIAAGSQVLIAIGK